MGCALGGGGQARVCSTEHSSRSIPGQRRTLGELQAQICAARPSRFSGVRSPPIGKGPLGRKTRGAHDTSSAREANIGARSPGAREAHNL